MSVGPIHSVWNRPSTFDSSTLFDAMSLLLPSYTLPSPVRDNVNFGSWMTFLSLLTISGTACRTTWFSKCEF